MEKKEESLPYKKGDSVEFKLNVSRGLLSNFNDYGVIQSFLRNGNVRLISGNVLLEISKDEIVGRTDKI